MRAIQFLCCAAGICFMVSCAYDVEEELNPVDPQCHTEALSYTGNIKQLVNSRCATPTCHAAGNGIVNLSTYAGVKQIADNGLMRQKVLVEKSMPPSGPLSSCEMQQLDAWLKAGAPQN